MINDDNVFQRLLSDLHQRLDLRTSENNLLGSFRPEMIDQDDPKHKEEILDGSIIPEQDSDYKEVQDLEEGDVWIMLSDFEKLTVRKESELTWTNFGEHYYRYKSYAGMYIVGKLVVKILHIGEDVIECEILGPVDEGKYYIKKDEHYDRYFDFSAMMMRRDGEYHKQLKTLCLLPDLYRDNKEDIEHRVDKIREIAEDIYPGRIEMKSIFDTPENSLARRMMGKQYLHALIIYFPEITITNRKDEEHVIEDLYTSIAIGIDGSAGKFSGVRGKLEAKEIATGYGHSHLSSGHYGFSGFCLGRGDFSNNLNILKSGYDEQLWEIVLTQMQFYLEWESISGGPYKRIQQAVTGGASAGRSLTQRDAQLICKDLETVLPQDMKDNVISITIHDSGDGSTQMEVTGFKKIAEFIDQEFDDYDSLENTSQSMFSRARIYVSSDNRRIGHMKLNAARNVVKSREDNYDYIDAWEQKGFTFKSERIKQEIYVDESLYDESYETNIVALNKTLERYLSSYIMMNFMNKMTQEVNQSEQQNDKYNEYKKQQEEISEEIIACTPVF